MNHGGVLLTRRDFENCILENTLLETYHNFLKIYKFSLIEYKNVPFVLDNKFSCYILTSKYAAYLVAEQNIKEETRFFVIGKGASNVLELNTKCIILEIFQDVQRLIKYLNSTKNTIDLRSILYLSGNIITRNLPPEINRSIIYNVLYAKELSAEVLHGLKSGSIKYVLIYSYNVALNFIKLTKSHDVQSVIINKVYIITISVNIASLFFDFKNVYYSENNNENEMLGILRSLIG